jgi:hypothetical protein
MSQDYSRLWERGSRRRVGEDPRPLPFSNLDSALDEVSNRPFGLGLDHSVTGVVPGQSPLAMICGVKNRLAGAIIRGYVLA